MEKKLPLDGIKVIDLTTAALGPTTCRYLADYGATVVKVESARRPDTSRMAVPFAGGKVGINRSGFFAPYNAGKLSLSLNLKNSDAVKVLHRLVKWADVLVEAYVPPVKAEWGLTYEEAREINPGLIMVSSCLQGQTGPASAHRGYGQMVTAMAGWYELTGWPDGEPVGPFSAYSDFIGWNYLLVSILAALDYRRRTGEGQYIDQSQYESSIQFLAPQILDYNVNGHIAKRCGNRDSFCCPHAAYRCLGHERWCVIAVATDIEWEAFCKVIGSPKWTKDQRFATFLERKKNEDELDALVEAWTLNHAPEEVMTLMQEAGVPAGLVENARDLFQDPQLKHRGLFVALHHAEMNDHSVLSSAPRLSNSSGKPRFAAPCLGEHTELILRDFLGMSDDEIAVLVSQGALE